VVVMTQMLAGQKNLRGMWIAKEMILHQQSMKEWEKLSQCGSHGVGEYAEQQKVSEVRESLQTVVE
jgi:hypothetical protein